MAETVMKKEIPNFTPDNAACLADCLDVDLLSIAAPYNNQFHLLRCLAEVIIFLFWCWKSGHVSTLSVTRG